MATELDFSTDNGKVRLLISDLNEQNPIFPYSEETAVPDAIDTFLTMALDGNVKRAAAQALMAIATNEVLVQKRIKLLDLSTDGPAEAKALLDLAKQYHEEADAEEIEGAFDWAEQINTPAQFNEFIVKDGLRNGSG